MYDDVHIDDDFSTHFYPPSRGVDPYGMGTYPPNILEVMSCWVSTRVSTGKYFQITKESG